ncbi:MAG: glyoxalase [Chloroflexi bacterium]|nr:glyoxalase [Chloroflexota bacterium]
MKSQIALVTIITDNAPAMFRFYRDVLGFRPLAEINENDPGYAEFEHAGVRFALCTRGIMRNATGDTSYDQPPQGQRIELAFPCDSPEQVDQDYDRLVSLGATPIRAPENLPWNQRAAFFADPDGNIHELFADLPGGLR